MIITVVGWPRSGTHWLQEMLRRATGLEVFHSHAIPTSDLADEKNRYIFIIRDPRDAFVSHYRLYLHDHPGTQRTQMEHLELFFKGKEMTQPYFHLGWVDHTHSLLGVAYHLSPFIGVTRHESLVDDTQGELVRILCRYQIPVDEWKIEEIIRTVSRIRCDPSSLPPEDMGRVGKYREILDKKTECALWSYCGNLMEALGYERR